MNFKNEKKVLVDFDGTLADTSGCWIEAYQLLCLNKNISPPTELTEMFGKNSFDRWQCIVEIEIRKKCSFEDSEVMSCAKTVFSCRKPKRAVIDFIAGLPNCKKEIITMEPKELVIAWLNYHGITFFDKVTTVRAGRADPEFYSEKALLLIDDNPSNCYAAKKAGATVIGVNDHHDEIQKQQMRALCDMYID